MLCELPPIETDQLPDAEECLCKQLSISPRVVTVSLDALPKISPDTRPPLLTKPRLAINGPGGREALLREICDAVMT